MEELSLSNALLDGTLSRGGHYEVIRYESDEEETQRREEKDQFPALVYSDPHKGLDQRILFKPPAKHRKPNQGQRRRHSEIVSPSFRQEQFSDNGGKSWDEVISEFLSKKKKSILKLARGKSDTLTRSLSWDTLHQLREEKEEEEKEEQPKTFIYESRVKRRKASQQETQRDSGKRDTTPLKEATPPDADIYEEVIPLNNNDMIDADSDATPYEIPLVSQTTPTKPVKPPRSKKSSDDSGLIIAPVAKPRTKLPSTVKPVTSAPPLPPPPLPPPNITQPVAPPHDIPPITNRHSSFVIQDIVSPMSRLGDEPKPVPKDGDIGLLKIHVLGIRLPQGPTRKGGGSDDDEEDEEERVAKATAKDGLFCVLSVNGKHSQFQSSLQPLDPIKQAAVWKDTVGSVAVFYTTRSQQVFVMCRKLPLSESDQSESSKKAQAECVGVGMIEISSLPSQSLNMDRGSIEDWSNVETGSQEMTVELEPAGSVLLRISYTCLEPQASVSCTGSVTITSLTGVDCNKEGEACSTCCTVDIDTENYGTTSSRPGVESYLSKGWGSEAIPFDATNNTLCRIQLWGITSQETEYWFGEVYIPLALVLPYSDQIVHQEKENDPFQLLDSFERDITMPIEPKGQIIVRFNMSPVEDKDSNIDETLKVLNVLEESGLFKPEALAQLKNEAQGIVADSTNKMSTINEEDSTEQQIPQAIAVSGAYDHLSPPPSIPPSLPSPTSSLISRKSFSRSSKMTLRLLGSLKLQVPKSYDERKHKINTEVDPHREMEIMKVELKDVKAKLAASEYHKEKAELRVKLLEEEVWELKQKIKKKNKK